MASKVNKKFVMLLSAGVVGALAIGIVGVTVVLKSAADHARLGESLMATDPKKAASSFSKAVSKEPNNTEFIAKWIKAISAITPESRQEYDDRYRDLIGATRRLAEVKRSDLAAHRAVLEPVLQDLRRSNAGGQAWLSLVQSTEAAMRLFPSGDKNADGLRRYRGIARTAMMGSGLRLNEAEARETRQDLEAALAFAPTDDLAAASLVDFLRLSAAEATQKNDPELAASLLAESTAKIEQYVAQNPNSTVARAAYTNVKIANAARAAQGTMNTTQFAAAVQPLIAEFLATAERDDPKTIDVVAAAQATELAVNNRVPDAISRGVAIYDRLVAARPNEPTVQFGRAQFLMGSREFARAAEAFTALVPLPNLPVSGEGLLLFTVRDMAAMRRVDALLGVWEGTTGSEARQAALNEAKKARDEVMQRRTVDDVPKLLMNGKIALAERDLSEARRLLGQYNARVPNVSVEGQLLLARVLEQQGLLGEARQCYQRIIDARAANLNTYLQKANLEIELRNYTAALDDLERARQLAPDNPGIQQQMDRVRAIISGGRDTNNPGRTSDPLVRILAEAEAAANATPPNFRLATEKLIEARKLVREPSQYRAMAQVFARMNNVGEAIATCEAGLAKHPGDEQLKTLLEALKVADPLAEAEDRIRKSNLPEEDKLAQLYALFFRTGQTAKAEEALAALEKLNANNATVVQARFDDAIRRKDLDAASAIAARAKAADTDKAGGRLFEAMILREKGMLKESLVLINQAIEQDPVNPMGHQLAGDVHFRMREYPKSAASLRRAMEIMPQNPQTIVSLMRVLLAMNEPNQALEVARGALRFGINEQAFVQLWLNLEFDFGDRAKAIDRRQRIFENNPEVTENAVSLATIMLRADRLDDAAKVITALEGNDADEIKTQAKLLRAAEVGLRGDSTRSEALFDEAVPKLNQNLLDGSLHIDFARMMEQQGKLDLAMRVLQKGRRYQRPETMFVDRTLGDMMFTNGRFVDALAAYTRARESVPKDDENLLRKRMVECLLRLERLEEAGRELAEMNPDKSEDTQVLLLASELARARGDRASAVKFLDKGVEQDPRSAVARVRRADFLIEDPAKFEDAVREYEEALRLDPKNARARLMYAECWARRGDVNRAVEELRSGLNQAENDEVRNAYVRLLLSLGRIADAANAASDGFKKSGDPKWVALEGFIHQQVGNLQLAADKFNQAWELRPGPVSGKQLVDVLLTMVPPEAARARAVIENPAFGADTTALGRFARARLSMIDRRAEQASADVKAALSTLNLTDVREGLSVMEEMTLIWPNPADLVAQLDSMMPSGGWPESMRLNIVTRRLLVESQRSEALAELERLAGSKEPRISISALSVMGTTYFNTNEPEKAVAAYRRGLEIDKDNLELLNNLAFVLSKGLKQHAEALPLAERAAAKAPTEPNIIDTLGAIKLEMGNIDEAQRDFERARSLSFDALVRTMPTVHLIEVKLRRKEMIPADQLLRELEEYEQRDVRVRANYGREIDRVRELRRSTR